MSLLLFVLRWLHLFQINGCHSCHSFASNQLLQSVCSYIYTFHVFVKFQRGKKWNYDVHACVIFRVINRDILRILNQVILLHICKGLSFFVYYLLFVQIQLDLILLKCFLCFQVLEIFSPGCTIPCKFINELFL